MIHTPAVFVLGVWFGVVSVALVSLTALVRDQHFAADLELSVAAVCLSAVGLTALFFICWGGLPALAMFIGSSMLGLTIGVILVRLTQGLFARLSQRFKRRRAPQLGTS